MADIIQLRNGFTKVLVGRDPNGFEHWVICWPRELIDACQRYDQVQYEKHMRQRKRDDKKQKSWWYKLRLLIHHSFLHDVFWRPTYF